MHPDFVRALADIVLIAHALFVAFVIVGLLLVLLGGLWGWSWIGNPWFRSLHLAAIVLVVVQTWLGVVCPLTTLELDLRARAGEAPYAGTFVGYWLQKLLYFEAPPWIFAMCYTVFGAAVVGSWFKFRPRSFRKSRVPKKESA